MDDERWMDEALALAQEAAADGEVPVGAVVVCDGQIVGRGRNLREHSRNALTHAELLAIDEACRTLGGWRLWRCTLYVTLEPCPMCAGAIINSRVQRVVFGARDPKAGACGSVIDLFACGFNHRPQLQAGVREEACAGLLRQFFSALRTDPARRGSRWKGARAGGGSTATGADGDQAAGTRPSAEQPQGVPCGCCQSTGGDGPGTGAQGLFGTTPGQPVRPHGPTQG